VTFAGGVVMALSLYISYSERLTSLLSHLRDASSCYSVYLGSHIFLKHFPICSVWGSCASHFPVQCSPLLQLTEWPYCIQFFL
jgi:hypothetical protein